MVYPLKAGPENHYRQARAYRGYVISLLAFQAKQLPQVSYSRGKGFCSRSNTLVLWVIIPCWHDDTHGTWHSWDFLCSTQRGVDARAGQMDSMLCHPSSEADWLSPNPFSWVIREKQDIHHRVYTNKFSPHFLQTFLSWKMSQVHSCIANKCGYMSSSETMTHSMFVFIKYISSVMTSWIILMMYNNWYNV